MDSCNSGSMQSSSGDEEFDSRAESISAFLNNNNNPLSHVGPMPNPPPPTQPPPPDHHHHHSSSSAMFDPLSNYFDPLSSSRAPLPLTNPNSLLNLDMVWSKNLRSEPNCTDLGGFVSSSSPTQQFFTNQTQSSRATFPSMQIPQGSESGTKGSGSGPGLVSGSNDQTNNNSSSSSNMVRNPKKRSRASRRAPTTVLTTDTTNFRAMVQEFTGIPAPPFTSSPFPRSRLDLFGTASTLRSAATHLDLSPPPYLLRPFAQKIQPPPPPPPFVSPPPSSASTSFSTSSLVDAIASTTTTNINNSGTSTNTTTNSSTSINYQLASDHIGLLKQPQNVLNINVQNPILNFHPFLQAPPKYPLSNSPILGSTKQQQGSIEMASNDSHLKMGVLEEFGLSTNLTGLQNIVTSSDSTLRRSDNNPVNWGGDHGVGSNEGDHHHQGLLRSINGNYNNSSQRGASNGKVNYSGSSSDFHGEKGPENAASRSEGMMESWICSSD